ncbi:hypothetical protein N7486_000731 [Penicillium sp. IBT 16267x]|nr:hypothetical protein N7486_000731 [Penicillium sp. IBT 16267x]
MKYPSVTELIVLVKLILHGVVRQIEELKQLQSKGLEHFHHILPRLIIALDEYCHARVLYAYFDDEKLKVQFTSALDFEKFDFEQFRRKKRLSPGIKYIDSMDWSKYHDMMDKLLKWMWPVVQGELTEE